MAHCRLPRSFFAAAIMGSLGAQDCLGPMPTTTLRASDPYVANFFLASPCSAPCPLPPTYTGASLLFDLAVDAPITVDGLEVQLYDEGVPGTTPNQVGNLGEAKLYLCPTTWAGQASRAPGSPGATWVLAAVGVYTVTLSPAASPIAVAPFALPAGQYGVLLELAPTNLNFHSANVNVGAVHPLLELAPPALRQDAFLRLRNRSAQSSAFVSTPLVTLGGNLGITYTPDPMAAYWRVTGEGCTSLAPGLFAANRPVLGTVLQLVTTDQPAGTTAVLTAIGLANLPGGLALDGYGMPACTLRVGSFEWWFLGAASPGGTTATLPLPGAAVLVGLPLYAQSAVVLPGSNPAGLLVGNGICLQLH